MIDEFIKPGTTYRLADGIYRVMDPDFEKKLNNHIDLFLSTKNTNDIEIIEDYEQLPFINSTKYKIDWQLRQEDLRNITDEIGNKTDLAILEVGPYNGWLSQHLHKQGQRLVCIDYFTDSIYGLSSKFRYKKHDWLSIQCNLEEPGFLMPCFDMIILNHGIQFFSGVEKTITQFKKLLKPGGKFMILGLFIFKDDKEKKKQVADYSAKFKAKTSVDLFMYPTVKGYLDKSDEAILKHNKIRLRQYKCCRMRNWVARIQRQKQLYYYGIFQ